MSNEYLILDAVVASLTIGNASSQETTRVASRVTRPTCRSSRQFVSLSERCRSSSRSGVLPSLRQQRRPRDRLLLDHLGR